MLCPVPFYPVHLRSSAPLSTVASRPGLLSILCAIPSPDRHASFPRAARAVPARLGAVCVSLESTARYVCRRTIGWTRWRLHNLSCAGIRGRHLLPVSAAAAVAGSLWESRIGKVAWPAYPAVNHTICCGLQRFGNDCSNLTCGVLLTCNELKVNVLL